MHRPQYSRPAQTRTASLQQHKTQQLRKLMYAGIAVIFSLTLCNTLFAA